MNAPNTDTAAEGTEYPRPLEGVKIAPFYGCQILRPSKLMGFELTENFRLPFASFRTINAIDPSGF